MKLKEWIEQNENFWDGDLIIKALKYGSYKTDDLLFETVLKRNRAKALFGEYEVKKISIDRYPNSDACTLKAILWVKDVE